MGLQGQLKISSPSKSMFTHFHFRFQVKLQFYCRSELPFPQWTSDDIASWLHDMGLHLYVSEVQRWSCRGQQLLDAPAAEIEKELSVKHPLHKKKIVLALEAKGRPQDPMSPIPILPGISIQFLC